MIGHWNFMTTISYFSIFLKSGLMLKYFFHIELFEFTKCLITTY